MKKVLFLHKLEEICGLPKKSLSGSESLQNSGFFDSLALLGLIAMCDKDFHINIPLREIAQLNTVNDLYKKIMSCYKE